MDLNPAPYRGDSGIAHVSEEFFKISFIGANVRWNSSRYLNCCASLHVAVPPPQMADIDRPLNPSLPCCAAGVRGFESTG